MNAVYDISLFYTVPSCRCNFLLSTRRDGPINMKSESGVYCKKNPLCGEKLPVFEVKVQKPLGLDWV